MPVKLKNIPSNRSWQPDWSVAWKNQFCDCKPATSEGILSKNIFYTL